MFEENDEEYNASNDVDFSDDEEVSDQFQDDENKDDEKPSFKIISFDDFKNIFKFINISLPSDIISPTSIIINTKLSNIKSFWACCK